MRASLAALLMMFVVGMPGWAVAALDTLRSRAEQGEAEAQAVLGFLHATGDAGHPRSDFQAVVWYRKAAEQGHARAQNNLGFMYQSGKGVEQDYGKAVQWHRKAADQGYSDAQFALGSLYATGKGVPQDYVLAHMWLNLAAASGIPEFHFLLAKERNQLAAMMTPGQIAEAQRLAREWKPAGGK